MHLPPSIRFVGVVLGSALVAFAVLWGALEGDAVGLLSNVCADLLLVAVLTVAVRAWLVRRDRRRYAEDARADLAEALAHVETVTMRAEELVDITSLGLDDLESRLRVVVALSIFGQPLDWTRVASSLERVTADHGVVDLVPGLRRIEAEYASVARQVAAAREQVAAAGSASTEDVEQTVHESGWRGLDAGGAPHRAVVVLRPAARELLDDCRALVDVLGKGYTPAGLAVDRIPPALPRWLAVTAWVAGGAAAVLWLLAEALPGRFVPGFGAAITGNVAAGVVAAAVGVALAACASRGRVLAIALAAAGPFGRLGQTMVLADSLGRGQVRQTDDLVATVRQSIQGAVNQLQHIKPDARLLRYAQLHDEALQGLSDGRFQRFRDVAPSVLADLGLEGMRVPTSQGLRLAELGLAVLERARLVYFPDGLPRAAAEREAARSSPGAHV